MKKICLFNTAFFLLMLTGIFEGRAQVYTGGTVGVHYEEGFYIDAAPLLGYRYGILDVGISPFYAYREYENKPKRYSFGNRIFTQITFFRNVFVHGEFEVSNVEISGNGEDGIRERTWIMGMPVGGGYRYNITTRTQAYGMLLYDVILDSESPVRNPIIRGGMVYSF